MIFLESAPKEAIWLNVIIVIVAVLIILAVVLFPVFKKIYYKKKGLKEEGHCGSCSVKKIGSPSRMKQNYDKKYKNKK